MAVIASLLVATPVAGSTTDDGSDYGHGYMIVELAGSPLAHNDAAKLSGRFDPTSRAFAQAQARLEREHARFIDRLARVAPEAVVVNEMFVTSNSVVLQLNGASPASVEAIGGVHRTSPSQLYTLDMNESVGLIGADGPKGFWAMHGGQENAGDGVRVGIIDSGIDSDHPFFWCKDVEFGGVYASGVGILPQLPAMPAFFGPGYVPGPGDPLYFSADHGTHVAGTVGGCVTEVGDLTLDPDNADSLWAGTIVSGVAPGVELWDYNVFPAFGAGFVAFGGSAFSHDIAAAIEDAVLDDMDVINMSLGGGVQGPHDFLAEVANAAVAADVTVVTSAGNEGPGYYTVGSPGSAADVIAVGATTNTRGAAPLIQGFGADIRGYAGDFDDFDGGSYDLVDWPGSDNLACTRDVPDGFLTGARDVVLIERGACTFTEKVGNAAAAGAEGVVVFTDSRDPGGMAGVGTIPAIMIDRASGLALEAALFAAYPVPIPVTITAPVIISETANELAGFSSRGPAPFTSIVKPDLVAPGVNILSSVLTFDLLGKTGEGWELFDGTSMASPHVAGAAALLIEQHDWNPAEVKSALVTTANAGVPGGSVFEQGGGLLDVPAADEASTFFAPSNASFGLYEGKKPVSGSVEITVTGATTCSGPTLTGDDYGWVSAAYADGTLTVDLEVGRAAAPDVFYGGYVEIDCDGGLYHIPWGVVIDRKG
jgi:minor extracellular serine protease Vpr